MGGQRVRRAGDAVEMEIDPRRLARRSHPRIEFGGFLRTAELCQPILRPRHATARHVRVELEWAEAEFEHQPFSRQFGKGYVKVALADEAPRANDV